MSRIKELRLDKGLSQESLAKILNVHQTAVSQWEKSRTMPDIELLTKMARHFDVSIDYLLGNEIAAEHHKTKNGVTIPVLGAIAAGVPIEAIEDILDYEEIPIEWTKDGSDFFGLRIKGNSMEPRIREDDIVIVRKQPDVNSGDVAVVFINGENATVKKIVKHENGLSLVPFNAVYTPKFFTDEEVISLPITIIGKVVELRGKF